MLPTAQVESLNAHDLALTITAVQDDGITTLTVAGEVDLVNADQLSAAGLQAIAGSPRALVVDLKAVTFMDSTGLSHLMRVLKAARPAPARVLIASSSLVMLFRITGMANMCEVRHVPMTHGGARS